MVRSEATTVEEYLEGLDPDRRAAIATVRECILRNLQEGYDEQMRWGMITYEIPLQTFSDTYNQQPLMYAAIASQKRHMSVYLMNIYGREDLKEWFEARYRESGKKLDIGRPAFGSRRWMTFLWISLVKRSQRYQSPIILRSIGLRDRQRSATDNS